jgi:hypothetical protein
MAVPGIPAGWFRAKRPPARAAKVAELVEESKRVNPRNTLDAAWDTLLQRSTTLNNAHVRSAPVPVTFRQAVSRWYENTPGGFDSAVENSQRALREHGLVYPTDRSSGYGAWSPSRVDLRSPVSVNWALGPMHARGTYTPETGAVHLNPLLLAASPKGRHPTLEHELTHALLGQSPRPGVRPSARAGASRFDDTPSGSATLSLNPKLANQYNSGGPDAYLAEKRLRSLVDDETYVMSRAELDPRVAEVRRKYAFFTGRDVASPQVAEDAWNWWRANRGWLEDISSPTELPTMARSLFDIYDALPDESKRVMFKRMTQVPAVMAPVGASLGVPEREQRNE